MNSLAFFEHMYVCGGGLVAKLSPTVCNPMGCSLQGSSVHPGFAEEGEGDQLKVP